MKKRIPASRIGLAAGILAVSMTTNVSAAQITEEKAKSIALEHAGEKADQVTFLKLEADIENDRQTYEVEFLTKDYKKYDYEILMADGTILSIDYDTVTLESKSSDGKTSISVDRAKELALEYTGQKADDVLFLKAEGEYENGRLVYETEFYTADHIKYKHEFNGTDGTVISWEYDAWGCLLAKENAGNPSYAAPEVKADAISGTEGAKEAALKKAGAKAADVIWKKLERDHDDGRLIYEGEFVYNAMEYEFEIDGATGVFLDWDVESIYD